MEQRKNFYFPIVIFLIVYISLFCILGLYNKNISGDDCAFALSVIKNGFWQAQIIWYMQWAGRIANTFFVCLFTLFSLEKVYPVLAFFNILTYIIALFILIRSIKPDIPHSTNLLATLALTAATLAFTFSLHESCYWLSGSPYFWCTSLIILALAFAIKALEGSRSAFFACIIVILINGTILEQPSFFQGVMAFAAMVYYILIKDSKRAFITGCFWLASIFAFLVMFFAPGVTVRMTTEVHVEYASFLQRIINAIVIACPHGFFTALKFFVKPIIYTLLLFLPLTAKKIPVLNAKISERIKIWHIVLITALIAPAMQFMKSWANATGFPDRAVSLTLWTMAFVWVLLFVFFYRGVLTSSESFALWSKKFRWPVLIIALLVNSNFIDLVNSLKVAPAYRAEKEAREKYISQQKAEGIEDIIIPKIKAKPALIYSDLPFMPEKGSIAEYYGVKSLFAFPEELSGDKEAINLLQNGSIIPVISLAEKGDTSLMYFIGWHTDPIYNSPMGLRISNDEAEKWYRMGAEKGDSACMRSLSRIIYTKDKSIKGILEAVYWLTRSQLASLRL